MFGQPGVEIGQSARMITDLAVEHDAGRGKSEGARNLDKLPKDYEALLFGVLCLRLISVARGVLGVELLWSRSLVMWC
ncbi:hypothetical protein [Bradyrhizobium sp. WSM1743]|uniref:hypothetical protein n=1 Tax=Bradyrhizobium sp. WSM1743 TaxID=318996 RepID=UPI000486A385|nr:hypothetical protein [Bradyrhizobium sp. WSM1743]